LHPKLSNCCNAFFRQKFIIMKSKTLLGITMVLSTVYTLRKKEYLRGGRIRHVVPDGFIYPAPVDACGSWVLLIALFRLPPSSRSPALVPFAGLLIRPGPGLPDFCSVFGSLPQVLPGSRQLSRLANHVLILLPSAIRSFSASVSAFSCWPACCCRSYLLVRLLAVC